MGLSKQINLFNFFKWNLFQKELNKFQGRSTCLQHHPAFNTWRKIVDTFRNWLKSNSAQKRGCIVHGRVSKRASKTAPPVWPRPPWGVTAALNTIHRSDAKWLPSLRRACRRVTKRQEKRSFSDYWAGLIQGHYNAQMGLAPKLLPSCFQPEMRQLAQNKRDKWTISEVVDTIKTWKKGPALKGNEWKC